MKDQAPQCVSAQLSLTAQADASTHCVTEDIDEFRGTLNSVFYPAQVDLIDGRNRVSCAELSAARLKYLTIGLVRPGTEVCVDPGDLGTYHACSWATSARPTESSRDPCYSTVSGDGGRRDGRCVHPHRTRRRVSPYTETHCRAINSIDTQRVRPETLTAPTHDRHVAITGQSTLAALKLSGFNSPPTSVFLVTKGQSYVAL
jgi:hypothetical protein